MNDSQEMGSGSRENWLLRWGRAQDRKTPGVFNFADRILRPIETLIKKPLFSCHMCGQCILHATGLVCPMECPKTMRNGPCGGTSMDGMCEVYPEKTCTWVKAIERSERYPWWKEDKYRIFPPVDWSLKGSSSYINYLTGRDHHEKETLPWQDIPVPDKDQRPLVSNSNMERLLRQGHFVVLGNVLPPVGMDESKVIDFAHYWKERCDAAVGSDNGYASSRMSIIASAANVLRETGLETVLNMTCRDRNRLILQSDILGANSLGIKDFLFLTGDHPNLGRRQGVRPSKDKEDRLIGHNQESQPVYDLDSLGLIHMAKMMRDEGYLNPVQTMKEGNRPKIFIGGAVTPTAQPLQFRVHRFAKKVAAGLDFVITQQIFDMEILKDFMVQVRDRGLDKKVYILVGIGPLSGPEIARWNRQSIPGVHIPDWLIDQLEKALPSQRKAEGIKMCVEQILMLKEMPGIQGINLMENEPLNVWNPVDEILEATGLIDRPRWTDENRKELIP